MTNCIVSLFTPLAVFRADKQRCRIIDHRFTSKTYTNALIKNFLYRQTNSNIGEVMAKDYIAVGVFSMIGVVLGGVMGWLVFLHGYVNRPQIGIGMIAGGLTGGALGFVIQK